MRTLLVISIAWSCVVQPLPSAWAIPDSPAQQARELQYRVNEAVLNNSMRRAPQPRNRRASVSLPHRQRTLALHTIFTQSGIAGRMEQDFQSWNWEVHSSVSFLDLSDPPKNFYFDGETGELRIHAGYLSSDYRYLAWILSLGLQHTWLQKMAQQKFRSALPNVLEREFAEFHFGLCLWDAIDAPKEADYASDPRYGSEALNREMSSQVWWRSWQDSANDSQAFQEKLKERHNRIYGQTLPTIAEYFSSNPQLPQRTRQALEWLQAFTDSLQLRVCSY